MKGPAARGIPCAAGSFGVSASVSVRVPAFLEALQMLSIRISYGVAMHLERKVADRDGYGVWSFHQSQSSWSVDQGRKTYRYARIKPADPSPSAEVEFFIVEGPDAPRETHLGPKRGVVIVL